jgi:hypothetical protein
MTSTRPQAKTGSGESKICAILERVTEPEINPEDARALARSLKQVLQAAARLLAQRTTRRWSA